MSVEETKSLEEMPAGRPGKFVKYAPVLVTILAVLAVAGAALAFYFYIKTGGLKTNPQTPVQEENSVIISKVSRLMFLPADEQPTVATVSDPEKLKDQAFFANAKKGDKVLIYTNAKKAILYDPEADKIVEVAPLNIGVGTSATAP